MDASKLKFSLKEYIQGLVALATLCGMWYDLKTDQRLIMYEQKYMKENHAEMKSRMNSLDQDIKRLAAILPQAPAITTYRARVK